MKLEFTIESSQPNGVNFRLALGVTIPLLLVSGILALLIG